MIRWEGAVAGVAAAAAAVGLAELVSAGTGPQSAPFVAVGGAVIDLVPEAVKQAAIQLFGTHDKQALLTGTAILLLIFAALVGQVALRRRWLAYAGIGLFGLAGMVAAATRHNAGLTAVVPSLAGAVTAMAVLAWLLRRAGGARSAMAGEGPAATVTAPDGSSSAARDRRRFLVGAGTAIGGAAVAGLLGREVSQRRTVAGARARLVLPTPSTSPPPVPAAAELGIPGLTPYRTANRDFYRIDTSLAVPQVDPVSWTLKIHGRVRNPMTLTFDDLLRRPTIERYVTLTCVSNYVGGDLISNALWQGIPVADLLAEAQPEDGADQVVSRSVDGFTAGTPTAVLLDGRDAMIAIGMNGQPLPITHGFPARMVVPGLYGYVSATKWLAELELTSFADFDAFWVRRGWAARAPIKTESRIDTPRDGTTVFAGTIAVAGVAWAQHRGISKVEVRVDGGDWQPATLAASPSIDAWRQWVYRWDAAPGAHRLQVRATDNSGVPQTSVSSPPAPDGATGYHTVSVTVT